jgi:integrase
LTANLLQPRKTSSDAPGGRERPVAVALTRAGIGADSEKQRKWMMHCCRHTAVSIWLSHGLSTRAVAEFIGDTEATVNTYSHVMPKDTSKAREAMEDFMNPPEDGDSGAADSGKQADES